MFKEKWLVMPSVKIVDVPWYLAGLAWWRYAFEKQPVVLRLTL